VLSQLQEHNPIFSRMSGSGASCFAIFETLEAAKTCAQEIKHSHPSWWTATGPFITN
jgi:4-diphosphocytidyl-2-C-methyl-D-erythritol kinase